MPDDDITRLLCIEDLRVEEIMMEDAGDVMLGVRTKHTSPICRRCGNPTLLVHSRSQRAVRHLDVFGRRGWLCFESRLVDCPECGIGAEALSFVEPGRRTTNAFRRYVGGLCRVLPNKQVAELVVLAEDTVRAIDKEYLAARYPPPDLSELRVIAVDEIAYRKGHNYLTLVLDYATGEVVWTGEGRREETLATFFKEAGPKVCNAIAAACMDMAAPFMKAVRAACPNAKIVFDRFHVAKHLNEAINDTRKRVMAGADKDERRTVKGKRFVLLKRAANLTDKDKDRLAELLELNSDLTKAYLLKEDFDLFWQRGDRDAAEAFLNEWILETLATGIEPMVRVATMVSSHFDGLMAYHDYPITNGPLEGLNTKINVLRRSRYGFRDLVYFGLKIRQVSIDRSIAYVSNLPNLDGEREKVA